jgi:hypothetical protein
MATASTALYQHLVSDARCTACGHNEPCRHRHDLTAAILNYGVLPQRRPGLIKAGLRQMEL